MKLSFHSIVINCDFEKKNENHGKLLMLFVNAIQSSICWWRTESRYETSLSKLTNFINDESSKHVWCHRIYPTVLPHFPRICHVLEFHVPRILKVTGIKTFQLALYNFYCVCFISSFEANSGAIKSFQTLWSFVQLIGTCLTSLSVKILKLAYFTDVVNFETGNGAFMLKLLTRHFFLLSSLILFLVIGRQIALNWSESLKHPRNLKMRRFLFQIPIVYLSLKNKFQ